MARRAHPLASPRSRGEGLAARPRGEQSEGEGASQEATRPALAPHPVAPSARLDLSPQAGRGGLVLLGEFGRAHGLKGEVRVKTFTADPKAIARYNPLQSEDGRVFTLTGVRPIGGGSPGLVIARVADVTTREAAETLNCIRLYAPRERLQGATSDDEFLLADLIGLAVRDKDGHMLGTVAAVPNYGGGDLLEVAPSDGGATVLLPFTESFVPEVDIAGGSLVVDAPDVFSPKAGNV